MDSPECLERAPGGEGCFLTSNPKAFDAPRATRGRLDIPSQIPGINEYNMYTEPSLLNYHAGSNYAWYPNNAEITYYVDRSIQAPFFGPNFGGEGGGRIWYEDYTDPMDSWKPHFYHTQACPENVSRLSFINDTTFFREDLMSRQMAKINQKRIEPFL
jgi:hypothetical protein